jgi:hypothetical protein
MQICAIDPEPLACLRLGASVSTARAEAAIELGGNCMKPCACWLFAAVLLAIALAPSSGAADPIQWSGNGHWYELIEDVVSWPAAEALAEARTWNGKPGYLATITSIEENDFIWTEVIGPGLYPPLGDPWLGGYQNPSHSAPDANWHWVTTEPWYFTNWAAGEPNDYCEPYGEQYLQFAGCCGGAWNDHHSEVWKAYVVEYSGDVVGVEQKSWGDVKALYR